MKHPEHEIQKCIALFLRSKRVRFTVSLAGVNLTMGQARRASAAGYEKGTPDITIFAARKGYHGMTLEVKAPKGYPSEEQKQWQSDLTAAGRAYA